MKGNKKTVAVLILLAIVTSAIVGCNQYSANQDNSSAIYSSIVSSKAEHSIEISEAEDSKFDSSNADTKESSSDSDIQLLSTKANNGFSDCRKTR